MIRARRYSQQTRTVKMRMQKMRIWAIVIISAALAGCQKEQWQQTLAPTIDRSRVMLRVAYAVNPRFPRMTKEQLDRLLIAAKTAVADHFKTQISFTPIEELNIDQLFATPAVKSFYYLPAKACSNNF